jgi:hypothetical protein
MHCGSACRRLVRFSTVRRLTWSMTGVGPPAARLLSRSDFERIIVALNAL